MTDRDEKQLPPAASRRAVAAPNPDAPPVTMAA